MSAAAPVVQPRKRQMACEHVFMRVNEFHRYAEDDTLSVHDRHRVVTSIFSELLSFAPLPTLENSAAKRTLQSEDIFDTRDFVRRVIAYFFNRFVPTYIVGQFTRYEMDHAWREWKLGFIATEGYPVWHEFFANEKRYSLVDQESRSHPMKEKEPSECLNDYMKFLAATINLETAYKPCGQYSMCILRCAIRYRQASVKAASDTLEDELMIPDGVVDICKEYLQQYREIK